MIAAAILAAGASRRLGRPKQLLPWAGETLIRHVARAALGSSCRPVLVVLGSNAGRIRPELDDLDVRVVRNDAWRRGMGGSVRAAVRELRSAAPAAEALVLLVCDQPRVTPELVERLCAIHREQEAPIVACAYAGTVGVPALFAAELFPDLERLRGRRGAKSVIERHAHRAARIDWEDGALDVDTAADLPRGAGGG